MLLIHCVKSVQIWSYFWSVFSCIRTEITPYLDTFHGVKVTTSDLNFSPNSYTITSFFKNLRNIFFSIVASKYINYLIFTLFRSSKTGMRKFQKKKKKKAVIMFILAIKKSQKEYSVLIEMFFRQIQSMLWKIPVVYCS